MSNSIASRSAWKEILNKKRAEFVEQRFQLSPDAIDANFLCNQFETLCKKHNEYRYTELFSQLQFHRIDRLADDIDELVALSAPDSLSAVASGSAFVAIEVGETVTYLLKRYIALTSIDISASTMLAYRCRRLSKRSACYTAGYHNLDEAFVRP